MDPNSTFEITDYAEAVRACATETTMTPLSTPIVDPLDVIAAITSGAPASRAGPPPPPPPPPPVAPADVPMPDAEDSSEIADYDRVVRRRLADTVVSPLPPPSVDPDAVLAAIAAPPSRSRAPTPDPVGGAGAMDVDAAAAAAGPAPVIRNRKRKQANPARRNPPGGDNAAAALAGAVDAAMAVAAGGGGGGNEFDTDDEDITEARADAPPSGGGAAPRAAPKARKPTGWDFTDALIKEINSGFSKKMKAFKAQEKAQRDEDKANGLKKFEEMLAAGKFNEMSEAELAIVKTRVIMREAQRASAVRDRERVEAIKARNAQAETQKAEARAARAAARAAGGSGGADGGGGEGAAAPAPRGGRGQPRRQPPQGQRTNFAFGTLSKTMRKEIAMAARSVHDEGLIISQRRLKAYIMEILDDVLGRHGFRVQGLAIKALRSAVVAMYVAVFNGANILAVHGKRITVQKKDIQTLFTVNLDKSVGLMATDLEEARQREENRSKGRARRPVDGAGGV